MGATRLLLGNFSGLLQDSVRSLVRVSMVLFNRGASIITDTILRVSYQNYGIMGPKPYFNY